ncbi:MAG TPA: patatin-like phospholipase family protein [Acetobacteraceae bacterium]|nr:patatin-like phospholipase family protein [Acetobacteraceae bacterium]
MIDLFRGLLRAVLPWTLFALAACQSVFTDSNKPLQKASDGEAVYFHGYALRDMVMDPKGQILLAVSFSGGGKRSAAFGHGALRGLRDITVTEDGQKRRLLDEVDYISAVSGGSFPAMHYGLYRDKSFETFPNDFLYQDINAYIYGTYLLPWNWEWLFNPYYGTNDRMAGVYDRLMFHGATYNDLIAEGLPLISINATDIANGLSFAFTQPYFDLLCSNLGPFPVARAVAASNGFPVLFSPITLTSYRSKCGTGSPPHLTEPVGAMSNDQEAARRNALARSDARYIDPHRTEYVHLMDGGIADNLALRSMLNGVLTIDASDAALAHIARVTRRVIVLSIDGQSATDPKLLHERVVTGLGQIFSAVSGTQIDSYNFETMLLADQQARRLTDLIKESRCKQARELAGHRCDDVKGAFIHISLADVKDSVERARLQAIPTGLTIPKEDADSLVTYGEALVRDNAKLHETLDEMNPTVTNGNVVALVH